MVPLISPGHLLQVEASVTDMSSPDLTMFSLPALYALITDTSTVAEPLGPVVKDVTLPVITEKEREKYKSRNIMLTKREQEQNISKILNL